MAGRVIERTATGMPGIDNILCAGLPKGRTFLIEGSLARPGEG